MLIDVVCSKSEIISLRTLLISNFVVRNVFITISVVSVPKFRCSVVDRTPAQNTGRRCCCTYDGRRTLPCAELSSVMQIELLYASWTRTSDSALDPTDDIFWGRAFRPWSVYKCRNAVPVSNKKDGYRQLNVRQLGSLRPWDHRSKCYMYRKRIQCLSNASQHVPIYLQPFLKYSSGGSRGRGGWPPLT